MSPERPGVSSALLATAVILILGGTAGIYVVSSGLFGPEGSSTTSQSTLTTSSTSSTPITSAASSTSSTSTSSSPSSIRTESSTSTSPRTSSTSTSSNTCSSAYTTSTGTGTFSGSNLTTLFRTYSEMALTYNTTGPSQSYAVYTSDYSVVSTNATMTKVNITTSSGSLSGDIHYTAWLWKNGTAAAVDMEISGLNFHYSGSYAELYFQSAMATFLIEILFSDPFAVSQLTSFQYVHVSGTGTVMLGRSEVSYTNYTAITLPFTITTCDSSSTYNRFFIQTGTVQGTQDLLVTQLIITGSQTYNGLSQDMDFTLQMTSVTKG